MGLQLGPWREPLKGAMWGADLRQRTGHRGASRVRGWEVLAGPGQSCWGSQGPAGGRLEEEADVNSGTEKEPCKCQGCPEGQGFLCPCGRHSTGWAIVVGVGFWKEPARGRNQAKGYMPTELSGSGAWRACDGARFELRCFLGILSPSAQGPNHGC